MSTPDFADRAAAELVTKLAEKHGLGDVLRASDMTEAAAIIRKHAIEKPSAKPPEPHPLDAALDAAGIPKVKP